MIVQKELTNNPFGHGDLHALPCQAGVHYFLMHIDDCRDKVNSRHEINHKSTFKKHNKIVMAKICRVAKNYKILMTNNHSPSIPGF